MAGSKEDFVLLFPLFAAAGYRVESFDIAGHYGSVDAGPQNLDPPREHYDYRLFIDDLIAILEDGQTPAHVLGYSFAGLVAELALVERPELFASLTLMAAPPAIGQVFRGVKHIGPISDMPPHRAAGLILWGIRYNLNRTPPMRIAFVRERMAVTGRPVIDDIVGLMMTMPDIADEVAAIDIPMFIAVGEQDLWPEEQHRGVGRAHRSEHRGVSDRPCAVRDGPAPARAGHARALRRRLSRSGPGSRCSVGTPGEASALGTE